MRAWVPSSAEYMVALAALADIVQMTWTLCTQVFFASAAVTDYQPILCVVFTLIIHMAGAWALYLGVQFVMIESPEKRQPLFEAIKQEFTSCGSQNRTKFKVRREGMLSLLVSNTTLPP